MSRVRCPALTFGALVMLLLIALASAAPPRAKRSDEASSNSEEKEVTKVCHSVTPCAWSVYNPPSRRVISFVKNICQCPQGHSCVRQEDDLSTRAFVHRCSPNGAKGVAT